jgi:hypothetical protein
LIVPFQPHLVGALNITCYRLIASEDVGPVTPRSPMATEPPAWSIRHVLHTVSERSWVAKYFGGLVIVALSAKWGIETFLGEAAEVAWDYKIDRIFILCSFAVLMIGSIARELTMERKEKYAASFERLENYALKLKNLNTYLAEQLKSGIPEPQQFEKLVKDQFISLLDEVSKLYTEVTGATCRAAIKCILEEGERIYVYTLARDRRSSDANEEDDQIRLEKRLDSLEENEDFNEIFSEGANCYLRNNLPSRQYYQNSSFKLRGEPRQANALLKALMPGIGWTLPYKSAIVFPIQQKEAPPLHFEAAGCIGFLTVDSPRKRGFVQRFDEPLGATLANALFSPLNQHRETLKVLAARG